MTEALGLTPSLIKTNKLTKKQKNKTSVVVYDCDLSTSEVEVAGSEVQGYPWLYMEFEASLGTWDPVSKIKPADEGVMDQQIRTSAASAEDLG